MKNITSSAQKAVKVKWPMTSIRLVLFGTILFLSGCAVSLAPKFNQSIVDNLSSASSEVFQVLATASDGTKKDDYNTREQLYNHAIGNLESLNLQISARPIPQNKITTKIIIQVNEHLKQKGIAPIDLSQSTPSATAVENITANITKMRDTDKLQGLTKLEVQAFKNNIQLFLDQALTYERFLNE